jgi:hypothetical protein
MALTADQRREEEEARHAAETAAALARLSENDAARRQRLGGPSSVSAGLFAGTSSAMAEGGEGAAQVRGLSVRGSVSQLVS